MLRCTDSPSSSNSIQINESYVFNGRNYLYEFFCYYCLALSVQLLGEPKKNLGKLSMDIYDGIYWTNKFDGESSSNFTKTYESQVQCHRYGCYRLATPNINVKSILCGLCQLEILCYYYFVVSAHVHIFVNRHALTQAHIHARTLCRTRNAIHHTRHECVSNTKINK